MVIFLTTFVVPRMSDLFAGFGNDLPTVTQIVLGLSNWLTGNAVWFAPLVIVSVVVIFIWSRTPGGRLMIDAFLLRLPLAAQQCVRLMTEGGQLLGIAEPAEAPGLLHPSVVLV